MSATIDAFSYGFSVELADGGPWLAQDGTVAMTYADRGAWATYEEAEAALRRSLEDQSHHSSAPQ